MKWIPFIFLAGITIVLQTTVAPYLAIRSIWPDLMFILVVYYALWGPWPDAAIACWLLGLLVDLQSVSRIGLHAFSYGGAAWAIMRVRQALFRDHPVTQILITFIFGLAIQLLVSAYLRWGAPGTVDHGVLWWRAVGTAAFTAALAPYIHWLLIRLGPWTGLRTSQRSTSRT